MATTLASTTTTTAVTCAFSRCQKLNAPVLWEWSLIKTRRRVLVRFTSIAYNTFDFFCKMGVSLGRLLTLKVDLRLNSHVKTNRTHTRSYDTIGC